MQTRSMIQRWIHLFPGTTLDDSLYPFRLMQDHYREPHRTYHVLAHPEAMLGLLDQYYPEAPRAVVLAIFLHDVIYNPGSPNSEAYSAAFARRHLPALGLPAPEVSEVACLIRTTKRHIAKTEHEAMVCDLDLLSLACAPSQYRRNTARLRQEYARHTDEQWSLGRRAFVERFLARDQIYCDPRFARFEARARANLARELAT